MSVSIIQERKAKKETTQLFISAVEANAAELPPSCWVVQPREKKAPGRSYCCLSILNRSL